MRGVLRVPCIVLALLVEEYYVVDIAVSSGVIVCRSSTPNYFIDELLFPKDFIEYGFCVVSDMPVEMDID